MRFSNESQRCHSCGSDYDETYECCPNCKAPSDNDCSLPYRKHVNIPFTKQVLMFLTGWLGIYVVQVIAMIGIRQSFAATHPSLNPEQLAFQLEEYLKTGAGLFNVFIIVYPILLGLLGLILWKDWPKALKSFKGVKPYIAAFFCFAAIIAFQEVYFLIVTLICKAGGWSLPSDSENQQNIIKLASFSPVLGTLLLGVIGPISEELAYRVGLFGFASRFGKKAGYIITVTIFTAIHIGWTSIGTSEFISELVSLPAYLAGAFALTYVYDKYGFAASTTAHIANNVYSVLAILASKQ